METIISANEKMYALAQEKGNELVPNMSEGDFMKWLNEVTQEGKKNEEIQEVKI